MGIATVRTLTVNQLCERKNDLIIPVETINELAKRERAKAIDEFVKALDSHCGYYKGENKNVTRYDVLKIAEQLKAGGNDE